MAQSNPCKHEHLRWDQGELYIQCIDCPRSWQAMQDNRLTPDYMARAIPRFGTMHAFGVIPRTEKKDGSK